MPAQALHFKQKQNRSILITVNLRYDSPKTLFLQRKLLAEKPLCLQEATKEEKPSTTMILQVELVFTCLFG